MSADSPRRSSGNTSRGLVAVPAIVPPQVVSDRSILDSAIGFINEVTLAHQPHTDPKDTITWARFETAADISDPKFGEDWELEGNVAPPLLLILGYGLGVQVWAIPANGEAVEVLSWRHGIVSALRVLPTPSSSVAIEENGRADEPIDAFAEKRPLIALVDGSSSSGAQPQFCAVNFISLKTGTQVKAIKFKNPVIDVLANRSSIVITFHERIAVFDARTLEDRLSITTCYPSPGINPNPVALGHRWLAYAEHKLLHSKRSGGGCDGEGVASYTATVLNASKSLVKGLRELGEQVAAGLTGTSGSAASSKNTSFDSGTGPDSKQSGIVTIVDIKNPLRDYSPTSGVPMSSAQTAGTDPIVAHFIAHSEALVAMEFDNSGMLLVTADRRGHDFHVFRIQPNPVGPSLAAVHHLYVLHRGDTSAKVQNISFSLDSRWVAVSTLRGTTHVFPITPYGGPMGVRTHTSLHVVNKLSRFHRSAGLSAEGRSSSPISHSESTTFSLSLQPYHNPTLPPYPRPTVVMPLAQLRQPFALGSPPGSATLAGGKSGPGGQGSGSQRQRLSSLSDDSGKPLSVCAIFAKSRSWLLDPPNVTREAPHRMQRKAVDSLFVMAGHGALIQYDLDTKLASNIAKEKICDDTPIELEVEAKAQWNLGRRKEGSQEIMPPLSQDNWLVKSRNSCMLTDSTRQYDDSEDRGESWLAQVEIVTHAGPHRRLWMGPQFVFKTYNTPSGSNLSHVDIEAVEIGTNNKSTTSASKPEHSSPLNMPITAAGRSSAVPVLIESGSYSSIEQSPKLMDRFRHDHLDSDYAVAHGDTRLKEDLADAMRESPSVSAASKESGGGRGCETGCSSDNIAFYDALAEHDDQDQDSDFLHDRQASAVALATALPNIHSYDTSSSYESIDSLKKPKASIEKIVNPLGTVTTVTSCLTAEVKTDILDEVVSQLAAEDTVIHENCDESLFRPVVTIFCDEKTRLKQEEEALKNQELCQPPENISNKLVVPVIAKEVDDALNKKEKEKNISKFKNLPSKESEQLSREQSKFEEMSALNRKSKMPAPEKGEEKDKKDNIKPPREEKICDIKTKTENKILTEKKQENKETTKQEKETTKPTKVESENSLKIAKEKESSLKNSKESNPTTIKEPAKEEALINENKSKESQASEVKKQLELTKKESKLPAKKERQRKSEEREWEKESEKDETAKKERQRKSEERETDKESEKTNKERPRKYGEGESLQKDEIKISAESEANKALTENEKTRNPETKKKTGLKAEPVETEDEKPIEFKRMTPAVEEKSKPISKKELKKQQQQKSKGQQEQESKKKVDKTTEHKHSDEESITTIVQDLGKVEQTLKVSLKDNEDPKVSEKMAITFKNKTSVVENRTEKKSNETTKEVECEDNERTANEKIPKGTNKEVVKSAKSIIKTEQLNVKDLADSLIEIKDDEDIVKEATPAKSKTTLTPPLETVDIFTSPPPAKATKKNKKKGQKSGSSSENEEIVEISKPTQVKPPPGDQKTPDLQKKSSISSEDSYTDLADSLLEKKENDLKDTMYISFAQIEQRKQVEEKRKGSTDGPKKLEPKQEDAEKPKDSIRDLKDENRVKSANLKTKEKVEDKKETSKAKEENTKPKEKKEENPSKPITRETEEKEKPAQKVAKDSKKETESVTEYKVVVKEETVAPTSGIKKTPTKEKIEKVEETGIKETAKDLSNKSKNDRLVAASEEIKKSPAEKPLSLKKSAEKAVEKEGVQQKNFKETNKAKAGNESEQELAERKKDTEECVEPEKSISSKANPKPTEKSKKLEKEEKPQIVELKTKAELVYKTREEEKKDNKKVSEDLQTQKELKATEESSETKTQSDNLSKEAEYSKAPLKTSSIKTHNVSEEEKEEKPQKETFSHTALKMDVITEQPKLQEKKKKNVTQKANKEEQEIKLPSKELPKPEIPEEKKKTTTEASKDSVKTKQTSSPLTGKKKETEMDKEEPKLNPKDNNKSEKADIVLEDVKKPSSTKTLEESPKKDVPKKDGNNISKDSTDEGKSTKTPPSPKKTTEKNILKAPATLPPPPPPITSAWKTLSGADMIAKNLSKQEVKADSTIYPSLGALTKSPKTLKSDKLLPELPTPKEIKEPLAMITKSTANKNPKSPGLDDFPTLKPLDALPPLPTLEPLELLSDTSKTSNIKDISLINFESPLQENPALERKITPPPRGFTEQNLIFALCGSLHYENEQRSRVTPEKPDISPATPTSSNRSSSALDEPSMGDYKSLTENDDPYISLEQSSQDTNTTNTNTTNEKFSSSTNSSGTEEIIIMEEKKMTKKQKRKRQQQLLELQKQKEQQLQQQHHHTSELDDDELRPLIAMSESQIETIGDNAGQTNASPLPSSLLDESFSMKPLITKSNTLTHSTTTDSEGPMPATTSDDNVFIMPTLAAHSHQHKIKTKKLEHKINLIAAIEAATSSSTSSAEESGVEVGGGGGSRSHDPDDQPPLSPTSLISAAGSTSVLPMSMAAVVAAGGAVPVAALGSTGTVGALKKKTKRHYQFHKGNDNVDGMDKLRNKLNNKKSSTTDISNSNHDSNATTAALKKKFLDKKSQDPTLPPLQQQQRQTNDTHNSIYEMKQQQQQNKTAASIQYLTHNAVDNCFGHNDAMVTAATTGTTPPTTTTTLGGHDLEAATIVNIDLFDDQLSTSSISNTSRFSCETAPLTTTTPPISLNGVIDTNLMHFSQNTTTTPSAAAASEGGEGGRRLSKGEVNTRRNDNQRARYRRRDGEFDDGDGDDDDDDEDNDDDNSSNGSAGSL